MERLVCACRHTRMFDLAGCPAPLRFRQNTSRAEGARYTGDMHPAVRLVALDMDGTLLATFAQEISRRNAQAVRAAQAAGMTVGIATARRTASTTPPLDGVGPRADTPLIASNGAGTRTLRGDAY